MKAFLTLPLFLMCYIQSFSQTDKTIFTFNLSPGYQTADFSWSIAGNLSGRSPDILSEVKWMKLNGPSVKLSAQIRIAHKFFVEGIFSRFYIRSGTAEDSDYDLDARQGRRYHAILRGNEGYMKNYAAGLGYYLIDKDKFRCAIIAGYLKSKDYLLLLSNNEDIPGEKSLRSSYQTTWSGLSGAIFSELALPSLTMISLRMGYEQLSYHAIADWNLIDAFKHPVSFTHHANGFALNSSIGITRALSRNLAVSCSGKFEYAVTGKGIDTLFLDSGNSELTRFNRAEKSNLLLNLGIIIKI